MYRCAGVHVVFPCTTCEAARRTCQEVVKLRAEVVLHNLNIRRQLKDKLMSEEHASIAARDWPVECNATHSDDTLQKASAQFEKRFGWSSHLKKAANWHLPYEDPRMQEVHFEYTISIIFSGANHFQKSSTVFTIAHALFFNF
jgi:hypothetical protein